MGSKVLHLPVYMNDTYDGLVIGMKNNINNTNLKINETFKLISNLFWENNDYVFLESSTDLDTWTTLGNSSPYADPVASQKFYRTKVIVD